MLGNEVHAQDVSDWNVSADELSGREEKVWLCDPGTGEHWLYKPVTMKDGHTQWEDWAEKMASHAAGLLTVPCAEIALALRHGRRGSLSRNLRPASYEMQSGLVLLSAMVADYRPGTDNVRGRPGHSLANIQHALEGALPPPNAALPDSFEAFDTFVGYLVLDAWVANRDRHDENWSVLLPTPPRDPTEPSRLSGSYDHAGCLGFNLRDDRRIRMLDTPGGVERWAGRGTAWRFEHDPLDGPVSLVALAHEGLQMASSRAQDYWIGRLTEITEDDEAQIFATVPEMSEPSRTFARELLRINRGRLLHAT
ncbi:hypothetical protein ND748_21130 [Frankia sp. AiPs1]|uniref:hypothetical protein n=1 Tax=Frankia sp. AiPs1 TaxID=573493 RepID=UPI002044AEF4|nr:hypothetical protein [Frankia sp. AiPs1]MCM3924159.1 hypothetical protein [Frankia sp. AiPs1]